VEYDLKVKSMEDLIKCKKENDFSLANLNLNGTNITFHKHHQHFNIIKVNAFVVKFE